MKLYQLSRHRTIEPELSDSSERGGEHDEKRKDLEPAAEHQGDIEELDRIGLHGVEIGRAHV